MKTLKHPFFIVCFVLWVANQLLELSGIYIRPLYSYLDDLLCFPLTLTIILAAQRAYFNNYSITIPVSHAVFAVAAFTFCFELVLPLFSEKYTADMQDVLAYSIGAFGFEVFLNKPLAPIPVR